MSDLDPKIPLPIGVCGHEHTNAPCGICLDAKNFASAGAWYEALLEAGSGVPVIMCAAIERIQHEKGLSFPEAYEYLKRRGAIIEIPPRDLTAPAEVREQAAVLDMSKMETFPSNATLIRVENVDEAVNALMDWAMAQTNAVGHPACSDDEDDGKS